MSETKGFCHRTQNMLFRPISSLTLLSIERIRNRHAQAIPRPLGRKFPQAPRAQLAANASEECPHKKARKGSAALAVCLGRVKIQTGSFRCLLHGIRPGLPFFSRGFGCKLLHFTTLTFACTAILHCTLLHQFILVLFACVSSCFGAFIFWKLRLSLLPQYLVALSTVQPYAMEDCGASGGA